MNENNKVVNAGLILAAIKSVLSYSAEHPEAAIRIHVDEFDGIEISIDPAQRKE